jgi:hypothetical protein
MTKTQSSMSEGPGSSCVPLPLLKPQLPSLCNSRFPIEPANTYIAFCQEGQPPTSCLVLEVRRSEVDREKVEAYNSDKPILIALE